MFVLILIIMLMVNTNQGAGLYISPVEIPASVENQPIATYPILENPKPNTGVLCESAPVFGSPNNPKIQPMQILPAGTEVQIRDRGRGNGAGWIMISATPPSWIDMSALCKR